MNHGRTLWRGILTGLAVASLGLGIAMPVHAQEQAAPTRAEFLKLQAEVRDQRLLIIQMMQTDQQRYDMLLRLLQGQASGALPPVAAPAPGDSASAPADVSAAAAPASRRPRVPETERRNGSIEGKVSIPGGAPESVYVYVDGLRGPPARGKSIEIRQEGRQFSPRLAVVQAGTTAVFPNFDSVFHNVFSTSPRNTFDLGAYRAGDKPRSVTLTSPGVVDVFCNMHQKMSASILVLPNAMYTKVRPDGTFRLENVPVGTRKLVAWSPETKASQQRVEVTVGGTQASFVLEHAEARAHVNKMGQAYGSYRD
jgi:plastocyanin